MLFTSAISDHTELWRLFVLKKVIDIFGLTGRSYFLTIIMSSNTTRERKKNNQPLLVDNVAELRKNTGKKKGDGSAIAKYLGVALGVIFSSVYWLYLRGSYSIGHTVVVWDTFYDVFPQNAKLEVISTGHNWTEGPAWVTREDGSGFLIFSDGMKLKLYFHRFLTTIHSNK